MIVTVAEPALRYPAWRANPTVKAILIADDEDDVRVIFRMRLEREYRVLEAANGAMALDLIRQECPDLLVLDWSMPDLNGIDLLTALRKDSRTAHLPVIMTSGHDEASDRAKCLEAGALAYLVKPVSPKDLEALIQEVFQRQA